MLRFSLTGSPAPPGVGAVCTRHRFRRSTCRACVDACPVQALSLSDSGPALNVERCVQCGNCLFACPVQALTNLNAVPRYYHHNRLIGPFSPVPASANELMVWHTQYAIRGVVMTLDDYPAWGREIALLNLRLQSLGEPSWRIYPPHETGVDVARRKILQVRRDGVDCCAVKPDGNTLRQAFPEVSAFKLIIDSVACLLCGACFRSCPTAVFTEDAEMLSILHQSCSGCGICVAVCPAKAISVTPHIHNVTEENITFYRKSCQRCESIFIAWDEDTAECAICRQHNHGMR